VKLTTVVPRLRMHGAIPPLFQYVFMAWYLVKHRDIFAFYQGKWLIKHEMRESDWQVP